MSFEIRKFLLMPLLCLPSNCGFSSKKYFSNERAEIKSFIKKTYNRKVTIEDIKELCKELFD